MNEKQRQLAKKLRSLDEGAAFEWLCSNYPAGNVEASSTAVWLIPHRSWSRKKQVELLNYYCLEKERPFLVFPFMKIMKIGLFLDAIRDHVPYESEKFELWVYRFRTSARNIRLTGSDDEKIQQFISEVGCKSGN
jgi:hypothetical protein